MKAKAETVLRIISAICQFYFVSYSATSLYLATTLTLPAFCNGDTVLLKFMTYLMWYILLNMMGNFFCIIYKSKLSIVKSTLYTSTDLSRPGIPLNKCHDHFSSPSHSNEEQNTNQLNSMVPLPSEKEMYLDKNYNSLTNSGISNNPCAETDSLSFVEPNGHHGNGIEILGGWQKCKDCFVLTPPRGKHCPLCKHCVLKRDHHCYFVGHCIGFHNQRFFVCFCLYGGLGGLYSLWLTWQYLRKYYEALQTWGLLSYMGPFALIYWALGYTNGSNVGMVMFWWWSFATSLMGCCYFFGQIALIIRGQTKWEFVKDKFPYRSTLMNNVHSVFGKFWPICFLVPAPFLGYVGDGADWDAFCMWKNL